MSCVTPAPVGVSAKDILWSLLCLAGGRALAAPAGLTDADLLWSLLLAAPTALPLPAGASNLTVLNSVTGFVGGGATKLDGQTTVGVARPQLYAFVSTTAPFLGLRFYQLRNEVGTEPESVPTIVHPDDYNALDPAVFEAL